jgi:DNA-directed RNA polymerase subunit RPC12/RpoP
MAIEVREIKRPSCSQCGGEMWPDNDSFEPDTGCWHYYKCPNCGHTKEID